MNRENQFPKPVIPFWKTTLLLLLSIPLFSFLTDEKNDNPPTVEPPSAMMCNPITRWNRLTSVQKDSLLDNDTLTNVIGFHSGLEDALNNPILVDIKVTGASNATDPATINRHTPGRWGETSFFNGRSTFANSGNKYCFTFSSAVPFEMNTAEHQFLHDGEQLHVTASLGGVPVILNGSLNGPPTPATLTGSGTTELFIDANNHYGLGVWWEANSGGNDVDQVCVEFYKIGLGQALYGYEPFTLSLCNTNRILFDDPFALTDPNAPPLLSISDEISLTKEIDCVAPSSDPGNVDVTFRLELQNLGTDTIDNIQMLDDLGDHMPAGSYLAILGAAFGAGHSVHTDPVFNFPAFNGISSIALFDGTSGKMAPGDVLVVDLSITMDANFLGEYDPISNQIWAMGTDESGIMASAASDAPLGAPGDTGGNVDGTLIYLPAINAAMWVQSFNPNPPYDDNGNVETTFAITVKNTGNTKLSQLQIIQNLENDLGDVFQNIVGAPSVIGSNFNPTPTVNPFFTGKGMNDGLLTISNTLLSPNDEMTVKVVALLDPNHPSAPNPLLHRLPVNARGVFPDMTTLLPYCLSVDLTDSGTDPASNNIGALNDTGGHNDPTPIILPGIRVAQHVAGVDYATSGNYGNFDVIMEVLVQNVGNVDLTDLRLEENLLSPIQLGSAFIDIVSAPQIVGFAANGTPNSATSNPTPNPGYVGTNELVTGGGLLQPGELYVVRFRIEVDPNAPGAPVNLKMQAEGYGTGAGINNTPVEVTDLSDSGVDPETSNPDRPGDTGGTNDPTPLTNCWNQISGGLSCNNSVQISLNDTCVANLTPDMIIEGEIASCANIGLLPLGAYYEIMMVTTLNGLPVPDMNPNTVNVYEIDGSYVGQTLVVKAAEIVYKNNCWGYITLEDKLGPVFDCPTAPVTIDCDVDVAGLAPPTLIDNCDPDPVVQFVGQQVIDNDICDDGVYRIRRTYAGHDWHDNPSVSQCIIIYELTRPGVVFPADISWHCEQYDAYPSITSPTSLHPSIVDTDNSDSDIDAAANLAANILQNTGSGTVDNAGGNCGYNISTHDSPITTCGNSFKIVRTWTVIDWCTGNVVLTDVNGNDNVQMIKIEDKIAPVITKVPFKVNATTSGAHPFGCVSKGFLPPPESISDNCDNPVTIQIITPVGAAEYVVPDGTSGGFIPTPGLPIGIYEIEYRATDACGNQSSIFVEVEIVDELTPAAICDEVTEVNLSSNGSATVFAATFDDGSNDNCCIDFFHVRRMNDPCDDGHDDLVFGPSVVFCCNDVNAGPQMVVFRVYDCNGNYNDCMIEAVVSDKIGPQILSCPPTQTISCDDYAQDYETQLAALNGDPTAQNELMDAEFGTPVFFDNCGLTISKGIAINLTQCLEGTVARTWQAMDGQGLASPICTQQITVFHQSDWVVSFPPDTTINCGDVLPPFGEPEIFNETCEMIAVSFEDDTLTVVPDACFKIVRTWAVINWCVVGSDVDQEVIEASELNLGLGFPACDLDGDGDCDNRTFRDSWNASDMPNNSMANQATGPDTDPDSDPWDGYIVYTQKIKIEDTTDPQFSAGCDIPNVCINDSTCVASVTIPDVAGTIDDCSLLTSITVTTDLPNGSGSGPYLNVPPGTYNVTYQVTDNCNNSNSCSSTVTVEDCQKPTVFCKDGFIAVVMQTLPPMIMVNAQQLDDGSFDNCSDVVFSFSSDTTDVDSIFFCHDIPGDSVEVWVTDEAGNQDFCVTFITIQGDSACMDDSLVVHIGGVIDTENGQPVQDVNVSISGIQNGYFMTDPTGSFQFLDLPVGNDVTLTPIKDDDHRNGVTTYDLVKISKHILGIEALDSPYKMIAADANRSGSITTFDLVEIRKLILYITDEFPSNTSWRFVPKDYVFPNQHNPWAAPFPEVININNVPNDVLDADFVAIKTGDVNGSAQTNIHDGTEGRTTNGSLMFFSENKKWEAGETVTLDLSTEKFEAVGFQFTLDFDPKVLTFKEVLPSLTDAGHFGVSYVDDGILTVSWNDYQSTWLEGQNIIELVFETKTASSFQQTIQLGSRYTPAEAYNVAGEFLGVELAFSEQPEAGFELLQNVPNPFNKSTTIGFRLGIASHATLSISDISGRMVKQYDGNFQEGYNEIMVERSDLPSSGIYYYRLDTPNHTATKLMILVE